MSTTVTYNGTVFSLPSPGDSNWAVALDTYLTALAVGSLTTSGGAFALTTADLNLGTLYGVVSPYYKSNTSNVAAAGQVRLANADTINWRNAGNTADNALGKNATSDVLQYTDSAGNVTNLTNHPKASYGNSANTSCPSGSTVLLPFATTVGSAQASPLNNGSAWNSATSTFTVPAGYDGVYVIGCSAQFTNAIASGNTSLSAVVAAGSVSLFSSSGAVPAAFTMSGQVLLFLSAGTTVQFKISQSSGSTLSLSGTNSCNYMYIYRTP